MYVPSLMDYQVVLPSLMLIICFFLYSNLTSNKFPSIPYRMFYLNQLSHLYVLYRSKLHEP